MIRKFFPTYSLMAVLSLFFMSQTMQAQISKVKGIYQDGDEFFHGEDYKEALYDFLQVIEKGYNNANLQYKIGVCYLHIPGQETRAIPYFEEAVKHITLKYKPRGIEEHQAPLHAWFYLGNAYRINNQLDKALEAYDKFTNSQGYEGNYNLSIVENEIKACERAKIIQDAPVEAVWTNLEKPVNTPNSDKYPVISGDGRVLIYLTSLKFYNAVYFTQKIDGQWQAPENIDPQILSDGEFYPAALSFDGTELYLVKQMPGNSDLYVSYYNNGKWSIAKPLNSNINTSRNEVAATLSTDGKTLYFASDRKESRGGYDIFKSVKGNDDQWGKAENLGKLINTKTNETSPSISADGKTLYFSSKGHYNMGGYDIFYSQLQNNGKWGLPVNIGYPVNTTNDNTFFEVIGNGSDGYISKISPDGMGEEDIYKVEIKSKFNQAEQDKNDE